MATKVDALAVAIGTSHGAYKFTRKPTSDVLAMDVIEKIHAKLPNTHIVMHGSSSVPEEYRAMFNENGGEMRETYGVPVEEIVRGIRYGVRKVNIDTDLRLAATAEFRRVANKNKSEFDPRKFLKPAMDAMGKVCRDRFEAFGCAGQAALIKVKPMSEMARLYASGALDPQWTRRPPPDGWRAPARHSQFPQNRLPRQQPPSRSDGRKNGTKKMDQSDRYANLNLTEKQLIEGGRHVLVRLYHEAQGRLWQLSPDRRAFRGGILDRHQCRSLDHRRFYARRRCAGL